MAVNPQIGTTRKAAATNARNFRTFLLVSQLEAQEIGARITQARKELGMTQEEVAEVATFSKRSLQDYEAGVTIPYRHLREISGLLKRPVEWFLHGTPESPSNGDPDWMQPLREELSMEIARLRGLNDDLEAELKPARQARKRPAR